MRCLESVFQCLSCVSEHRRWISLTIYFRQNLRSVPSHACGFIWYRGRSYTSHVVGIIVIDEFGRILLTVLMKNLFAVFLDHRVQSYSRDKTDWTVQSPKLSYSKENNPDIGLKSPLYIDIGRSIQILCLVVKFEKRFGKQRRIHGAFGVFILSRKKSLLTDKMRKMQFSLFPRLINAVY